MPARLLSTSPISRTIQERRYEAVGACTWVEFSPENGLPWVGVFGHHGVSAHSGVFEFTDDPFAFVIANGVGWIVNVEDGALRFKTKQDCLVTGIPFAGRPFVVAADSTDIHVYGPDRLVWSSDRIALDGIRFDNADNASVNGRCWQPDGWYAFHLRSEPWAVVPGDFITSEW